MKKCAECKALFTPSENYHRLCSDCYLATNTTRKCEKCPAVFVPFADYHTLCAACYRAKVARIDQQREPLNGYLVRRWGLLGWLFRKND